MTDDPHAIEEWWQHYLAQVDASVRAAEEHLAVPPSTISSIQNEPDFIAAVKTYAVIEPILNDVISTRRPQMPFGVFSAEQDAKYRAFVTDLGMSGKAGKLRLAQDLALLTQNDANFIRAVASVRNRYAHNVRNMHRSLTEIVGEEKQNNAKIVEHLIGVATAYPFTNEGLKLFMYRRLARYLADARHTLEPPELPESGILGALFKPAPSSSASAS